MTQNIDDDPNYHLWLAEMAKHCRAEDPPCEGCCAGGECDGPRSQYEDDDEEYAELIWEKP